jgi:ATP-dependent DNA helicase RecG
MIDSVKISMKEVKKLLEISESHFCDLKAILVSPGKLSKALAAFSNAEGGELFIGIEDSPRKCKGFTNIEAANAHLQVFESFSLWDLIINFLKMKNNLPTTTYPTYLDTHF